jgi:PKD domain
VAALAAAQPAAADPPVASFTYQPTLPLTAEVATFTSTSTGGGSVTWDLDGGGQCDDATGPVATRSFALPGSYGVRICINGDEATQLQTISVGNRPPLAAFGFTPPSPLAGEPIAMTSVSTDPEGLPLAQHAWDLDGDGAFDDSAASGAPHTWPVAGVYSVALRVTDQHGATAETRNVIWVGAPPPGLLSPFPTVRLVGGLSRTGAAIRLLAVNAPEGALVTIDCRGRDCPYKRKRRRAREARVVFPRLERELRAGTVIEIRVTAPGTIGKYTRFRIRSGERPARLDRCLDVAGRKPVSCPESS